MGNNYNEIKIKFDEYEKLNSEINTLATEGIKDLLKEYKLTNYNLIDNDIFVTIFDDGSDYTRILCDNIYVDNYDILHIETDNNSDYESEDVSTDVMYYLYSMLYEHFNDL